MNHPRLRRFLFLLFSFSLIQGLFAGESVTFPTYSTATINSGTTGVTTPLTVSSVPSNDYLFVSVTGDFAPGAGAAGIYSNDMLMELSDGGSNVYWPGTKATHGTISGAVTGNWAGAAALKWHGLLPKTYAGGTSLSVRFYSPAGGTGYNAVMNNVVVTIHPTAVPLKNFGTFNTGALAGGGAAFTRSLDVSGMTATEYAFVNVTASFTPAVPSGGSAFSSTIQMELNNGSGTVFWPSSRATTGQLENTQATTLRWIGLMPTSYTSGALSVAFKDGFAGPYTSSLNNVSISMYPVALPKKTFTTFNSGPLTGGSSVTKALDVTGIPASDYIFATVTGTFTPAASNSAWSDSILMELNNGGATVFLPPSEPLSGALENASTTTLKWETVLPRAYVGGGPLNLKFIDTYATGSPTSEMRNVVVTLHPAYSTPTTITSLNRVDPTPTNAPTVNWQLTFPTAVTGVTASNFSISPTVTGAAIGTPTTSNSGLTWNIPVTTGTGGGSLQLNLANTANLSRPVSTAIPYAGQAYTIDKTAPTIAISAPSASATRTGPVTYTVTYTDPNFSASTLATGSITLNPTGTATGTLGVTGTGNTRTVSISGISGNGTLGITIAAGTATDTAGNSAPASSASATFTVDNTAPTVGIGAPSASATRTGPVTYTVTYTDTNFSASTLATGNITLNATDTATGTLVVTGTGNTRTVSISSIAGNGTLGISIGANTATDTAGNNAPASSASTTFTVDNTGPSISIGAPSATLTRTASVTYTVTYADTNFTSSTLATGNITLNPTGTATGSIGVSGTGNTRTVTISSITGDGTLGISIAAGTATDTVGNASPASSASTTFTVDNTAPVITSPTTAGGTYQSAFTYTIAASGTPTSYNATGFPTGLSFAGATLSGSPTQSGPFSVTISATDAAGNTGSATLTLTVAKATATVSLEGLTQTYDGSARTATATTTPAGLTVDITYNGSSTAPTAAGSYAVAATIDDPNRQGTASGTLEITKVALTVTPITATRAYGAEDPTFGFNTTGFVGSDTATVVSGAPAIATTAGAASPPGAYPLTATVGTLSAANYTFTFAPSTFTITKQDPDNWNDLHFTEEELQDPDISGPLADADGDDIANLIEMAFGTDPRDTASGPVPLSYTGTFAGDGTLSGTGQPIPLFEAAGDGVDFRAVFVRRNPAFNEGLVYTPQFSADMTTWQDSAAIPVVLAVSGDLQIVSVPYPLFVAGKKARFFRISVSLVP